jgi:hypothetical protein
MVNLASYALIVCPDFGISLSGHAVVVHNGKRKEGVLT